MHDAMVTSVGEDFGSAFGEAHEPKPHRTVVREEVPLDVALDKMVRYSPLDKIDIVNSPHILLVSSDYFVEDGQSADEQTVVVGNSFERELTDGSKCFLWFGRILDVQIPSAAKHSWTASTGKSFLAVGNREYLCAILVITKGENVYFERSVYISLELPVTVSREGRLRDVEGTLGRLRSNPHGLLHSIGT